MTLEAIYTLTNAIFSAQIISFSLKKM